MQYLKTSLDDVFDRYAEQYSAILNKIYPSKGSTGFTERNLSVNFSKAYEDIAGKDSAISWFEFQFGAKSRQHVDLVLLDYLSKELYIVEAKRFSNPTKKIAEIGQDIERIYALRDELVNKKEDQRADIRSFNHNYGMILADVWLETDEKKAIYESFESSKFLNNYQKEIGCERKLNPKYYCRTVKGKAECIDSYKLVSMVWDLR